MNQPRVPQRYEPNSLLPTIGYGLAFLGGTLWITLSPLQVLSTGSVKAMIAIWTEPLVSVLALLSIYTMILLHGDEFERTETTSYLMLIGGFLLIGVPSALQDVAINLSGILLLGQPDSMLLTTVFGLLTIYPAFMLLGIESANNGYSYGRIRTYILLAAFPTAVGAFILSNIFDLSIWVTTAVTPAGIALITTGSVIPILSKDAD